MHQQCELNVPSSTNAGGPPVGPGSGPAQLSIESLLALQRHHLAAMTSARAAAAVAAVQNAGNSLSPSGILNPGFSLDQGKFFRILSEKTGIWPEFVVKIRVKNL